MPIIKYKAKVLPDGHLSCPESIKEKLRLKEGFEVRIIMETEEVKKIPEKGKALTSKEGTGLCGIWEDDRNAEDIIKDIHSNRTGFKEVKI